MTRRVLYVAAPLRPTEAEIRYAERASGHLPDWGVSIGSVAINLNLQRAMRWLSWLRRSFPGTTFTAPWIASIMAGADDSDPVQRQAGMADNFAIIERCDGIVLCGGRISDGMRREMEHRCGTRAEVYDLTGLGSEPPFDESPAESFIDYTDRRAVQP